MREIKFRAWDGKEMRFSFLVARPQFADALSVMQNENFAKDKYRVKEWKLMQYTGLKDKNGKEIYEGDILNGLNRIKKIVYWCDKRAAFCESEQFKPTPAKHSFAKLYYKYGKAFNENRVLKNYIVIGNIYENPELITN